MTITQTDLLATGEAAALVGLSPRTLERYRVTGEGPRFLKLGRRVVYPRLELDNWLATKVRRSTSDPGPGPLTGTGRGKDGTPRTRPSDGV